MPFEVPPLLLERLRARRLDQRQLRATRSAPGAPREQTGGNFVDSIRHLFSGTSSVDQVAGRYVAAMNAWQREVEDKYDAFLLDPGMGPMTYLTSDGRVLEDLRGWDGDEIVEVGGLHAHSALIVGARKTGIAELLELIPKPPPGSSACSKCNGKRVAEPAPGFGIELPCDACDARGWIDAV
ncbi:hypothetical protein [Sorangium sp. So ce381]|uniref:hypothetical protein n=1 Tax=Sorangium sp. So ce381 TaxID=3133307 RepID=UPI003F5C6C3A